MIASILLSSLFLSFLCLFTFALFRGRALDGRGFSPTGKTELKVPKSDGIAARPRRNDIKVDQPPLNDIIQAQAALNDIIATSSREQGSEVARPPLTDNVLAHVARNDIIAARPRWNDITADRPPMNDIIQARRARNHITEPIPQHGNSSRQIGHSSPLPPFLLFSLGAQWAHAQLLQGVDTAPLLAYAPLGPGPTFALASPFQKHWGLFSRVATPSLPELEHFRQHVVGNPFAPRRAETRQRWPTSGHGTIEHSTKKRNRAQRSTNGNIAAPIVIVICIAKPLTQPPQSSAPLRYSSVTVCWSTTICGVETICRSGFIGEGLDTIRCIMEIKHTTYGTTYTPREPPAASREATTPKHKFFPTSLPSTGSIIDTTLILVATNLAVRQGPEHHMKTADR